MAGSLIKIDEEIVTSAVASVTLTGIDSTYDVYMLQVANVQPSVDTKNLRLRVTTSGTPDTNAEYNWAAKGLNSGTTFFNNAFTNQTNWYLGQGGTGTGELTSNIGAVKNILLIIFLVCVAQRTPMPPPIEWPTKIIFLYDLGLINFTKKVSTSST